jgi:hypothetical protein
MLSGLDALFERQRDGVPFDLAVPEPVLATLPRANALSAEVWAMDQHWRSLPRGRLEQEFLPPALVRNAVRRWRALLESVIIPGDKPSAH